MRLASWNIRGLGNKSRGRLAGAIVNRFQLHFFAIQETMVNDVGLPVLNEIWKHYAFDTIQVQASGRSGGLLSSWRTDVFSLVMAWKRKNWIATILRYSPSNNVILIVNVYAPLQESKKKILWAQLCSIARIWPGPLCFMGDFNSVCCPGERLRENIDLVSIANFKDFINNASLFDLPLSND
ncbi:uncharacterized protein [Rutidosis leptorrhynchoides]|uniref:uncharacterized protein n=1 Tax=Rutidosis leptorrhynchoides TaxID=125765 RepID=UPI003A996EDD